jgi:hypothetical protein
VSEPALTGHCLCGGVRFEIDAPLKGASYCHCTRCQRRTGTAASAQAGLEPGALRFVAGEELVKTWWPPPPGFGKAFCGECGGHLGSRDPEHPERLNSVRLGAIDGDPGVRPSRRHHTATAAVWEPIPDDGLPRRED